MTSQDNFHEQFERFRSIGGHDFGDWNALMAAHEPRIRATARGFRQLCESDVDDVVQEVWERFWCKMGTIRDPEALGAWLTTTTRNRAVQRLRRRRLLPCDEFEVVDPTDVDPAEKAVHRHEEAAVRRAWSRLRPGDRTVLGVLVIHGRVDYRRAAQELRRPVGSLGPTRRRALLRLRALYVEEFGDPS